MRHDAVTAADPLAEPVRELIWLVGQPPLTDYLGFVKHRTVAGDGGRAGPWVDEWRIANDHYHDLSQSEAGLCETIDVQPLPAALRPLEAEVRAHRWFRHSFGRLPATFAMVELDKLIVSQTHVEPGHQDAIAAAIGDDLEQRFRFCIPLDGDMPPVAIDSLGDGRWLISSPSTDLRARSPRLMTGEQLDRAGPWEGPVALFAGVPLGFGCNFMSAVQSDKRIVLQNGYHRAYALRRAGVTHAPCIIEHVTRRDELRIGGDEEVNADPAFYFAAPRPPLLKDFFDPRFAKTLSVKRIDTIIEVEVRTRSGSAVRETVPTRA